MSDEVGYFINLAVCLDARNALHNKELQVLLHRAAFHRHYRREECDARVGGQCEYIIHHVVHRLPLYFLARNGGNRAAYAGVEQFQVVINLRRCAHGAAGVARGGLLLDGDSGRYALDVIHFGLRNPAEKLPRIRRQRLYIPPLTFGVQCVEGKRTLARAAQSGDYHKLAPRYRERNVFEVVEACAFYNDVA